MNELLAKLSSYNFFNYLLPGVLVAVVVERWTTYVIFQGDIARDAFVAYFVGLVVSRIGSLVLEPLLKKASFVVFVDYCAYVSASRKDLHLLTLSEANNTYRTLLSAVLVVLVAKGYALIETRFAAAVMVRPLILLIGLAGLFLFAYRKQTAYIVKRVEGLGGERVDR